MKTDNAIQMPAEEEPDNHSQTMGCEFLATMNQAEIVSTYISRRICMVIFSFLIHSEGENISFQITRPVLDRGGCLRISLITKE